jgi:tRNA(His) guanylyltransferase
VSDDALGDRMKACERMTKSTLPRHCAAILRVDGRAFHTYTRSLKANDPNMMSAMLSAAVALCEEIQGARMAYTQSDEISVLVNPWSSPNSQAWFGGDAQKIVSVSASIAAASVTVSAMEFMRGINYAHFDARVFTLPTEWVNDYFVWRQLDANRNALNGHAQEHFSARQLHSVKVADVREMLRQKGAPFEALPTSVQRGVVVAQHLGEAAPGVVRNRWRTEPETPWFASDPAYVGQFCEIVKDSARVPPKRGNTE